MKKKINWSNKYSGKLENEPNINGSRSLKREMRKFIDSFSSMNTKELLMWFEEYKNPKYKIDKFVFKCICEELESRY